MRLQPNHPADDVRGMLAAVLDGLMYGCGDAFIGVNPVSDDMGTLAAMLHALDEVIRRFEIPTQGCVLAHVTTQLEAMRAGLPVDIVFQSITGTEAANRSFGITLAMLREACEAAIATGRGTLGGNVMYFETGQGSALSAEAHHGVDQQTCEARAYGVARAFDPLICNTVVGFIGPEHLHDGKQIIRAGLEDHFCGKLLGLPIGCDVCYTNHAEADADDMDTLMTLLATAGVMFLIGVPGADDVMLGYQRLPPRCALPAGDVRLEAGTGVRGLARADGTDRHPRPPAAGLPAPPAAGPGAMSRPRHVSPPTLPDNLRPMDDPASHHPAGRRQAPAVIDDPWITLRSLTPASIAPPQFLYQCS